MAKKKKRHQAEHSQRACRIPWWRLAARKRPCNELLQVLRVRIYSLPGTTRPNNNILLSYVTTAHAIDFANDLKLAHYLKIPQRQTFWAQIIVVFVSAFVCTGVMNFQITKIPDMCQP